MSRLNKKILVVLLGILMVVAPCVEAATPFVPVCDAMVQMKQGSCCDDGCDCTLGVPTDTSAYIVPLASHRIEPSADLTSVSDSLEKVYSKEPKKQEIEASPPPATPLYDAYSDYRL